MNDTPPNDDIDIIQAIETLWDSKWKIISIMAACVVAVYSYQALGPRPSFVVTTKINPMLASDAEDYRLLNSLNFFEIYRNNEDRQAAQPAIERQIDRIRDIDGDTNRGRVSGIDRDSKVDAKLVPAAVLDELFIEQLGNHALLSSIFRKHALLERDNFESEEAYERALAQLAATVSILPPVNIDGAARGESRRSWTMQFAFDDPEKTLVALKDLGVAANKNVQDAVKSRFEKILAAAKQKRQFEIEDLNIQISNMLHTYDLETVNRLAHLKEQAAIARKLGIVKQTSIPQPSIYQNLNTTNNQLFTTSHSKTSTDTPLYLRGYDALEKEAELIKARKSKHPFIDGLPALEQKKLALLSDNQPERAERFFNETPIVKSNEFQAVSFDFRTAKFQTKNKRKFKLALAAVVGGMFGAIYVLITTAIQRRKKIVAN